MSDVPAIELDRVTVRYGGQVVLDAFSLACRTGERVVLRGPSGSGKTTVLRCLLGFARADCGEVRVEGRPLGPQTVWPLRRRMAYVAQEPDLGEGTVRETIERPFSYKANEHLGGNLDRVGELLRAFRLGDGVMDQEVTTLSGGEKQRVGLVTALLLARPILLLDEPSSALDGDSARAVVDYLATRDDLTLLAVSHDATWSDLAHRTLQMAAGAAQEVSA